MAKSVRSTKKNSVAYDRRYSLSVKLYLEDHHLTLHSVLRPLERRVPLVCHKMPRAVLR
jgi:hypothetical protein